MFQFILLIMAGLYVLGLLLVLGEEFYARYQDKGEEKNDFNDVLDALFVSVFWVVLIVPLFSRFKNKRKG